MFDLHLYFLLVVVLGRYVQVSMNWRWQVTRCVKNIRQPAKSSESAYRRLLNS